MGGKGSLELTWLPKGSSRGEGGMQKLKMLCCVPIVIIPTDTVPIDYALFFVSPFHPKAKEITDGVPPVAKEGFDWREYADGTDDQVLFDAFASGAETTSSSTAPPGLEQEPG